MKTIFCFIVCFIVFKSYSQVGDTVVFGRVIEYKTKKPIPNSNIVIVGTDGLSMELKANENGEYFFDKSILKEGESYVLTCGLPQKSFLNKTTKFTLVNGFPLVPIEILLELDKRSGGCGAPPNIVFPKNSSLLTPEDSIALDGLFETLIDNPTIVIEISGHADFREINPQKLSETRANVIVQHLAKMGIEKERLIAIGYGDNISFVVAFDFSEFKAGDRFDKEFIKKLSDPKLIEETIRMNGASQFKVLRSDYKSNK